MKLFSSVPLCFLIGPLGEALNPNRFDELCFWMPHILKTIFTHILRQSAQSTQVSSWHSDLIPYFCNVSLLEHVTLIYPTAIHVVQKIWIMYIFCKTSPPSEQSESCFQGNFQGKNGVQRTPRRFVTKLSWIWGPVECKETRKCAIWNVKFEMTHENVIFDSLESHATYWVF